MQAISDGAAACLAISIGEFERKLTELTPTTRRVTSMISEPMGMSASQQNVYSFLVRYIRSLNADMLGRFLRFARGSNVITVDSIDVHFSAISGLSRHITSHTCSPCLHMPTTYSSYTDFRAMAS